MPVCSVCSHPQIDEINKELLESRSVRDIAGRYDLTKSSVDRHYQNHIPEIMKTQVKEIAGSKLVTYIDELRTEAADILRLTKESKDYRTALMAIRELNRIVDTLAKIQGNINEGTQITINNDSLAFDTKFREFLSDLLSPEQKGELAQWIMNNR